MRSPPRYPGMAHGFLGLTDRVSTADEAMDAVADFLRERFA